MADFVLELPGQVKSTKATALDATRGPFISKAVACQKVEEAIRHEGLTVMIEGDGEYWWRQGDFSDAGLIKKETDIPASETITSFETTQVGILDLKTTRQNLSVDLSTQIGSSSVGLIPDANFYNGVDGNGSFYQYGGWDSINGYAHCEDGSNLQCSVFLPQTGDYFVRIVIDNLVSGTIAIQDNNGLFTQTYDEPGTYEIPFTNPYGGVAYFYIYADTSPLICDVLLFDVMQVIPGVSFAGDRFVSLFTNPYGEVYAVTHDGTKVSLDMLLTTDSGQTINGYKYFTQLPSSSATPTSSDHLVTKAYVDNLLGGAVQITVSELRNKRNYGQLSPLGWYILTDWQLTHTIPYTNVTYTSYTERIMVQAISPYALSPGPGYSLSYPTDMIWYSLDNDSRMPGATKGFIFRRFDTAANNDLDIDFRNVRFRRWYVSRPENAEYYGYNVSSYQSATDNGSGNFQDRAMFENYSVAKNNNWRNFPRTYSQNIFDQINFVQGYQNTRFSDTLVHNSAMLNITIERGWVLRLEVRNSTINGYRLIGLRFFDFFGGTILHSTIQNYENNANNLDFSLLYTKLLDWGNQRQIGNRVFVNGEDMGALMTQTYNSTVISFAANAEYVPITSGTFTVDVTNKVVGRTVTVYLGPACTAPILDATKFQVKGTYIAGKNLEYMFKVGANGFIQCVITPLD